ncbi:MAG: hypothetical protein C0407_19340, partial [Desulfobacca sp.]|nr:hypothetical protein [Desulfobacca sp.]
HSIVDILEYVLEVLGEEFRQNKIQVHKRWEASVPWVRCDRFQLTQAFINILHNALEAMPEGGAIGLTVKAVPSAELGVTSSEVGVQGSEIGIRRGKKNRLRPKPQDAEPHGDFAEISVADTGQGIPPEGLSQIFAPYYTTKEKGVGLGLAITQKIVQAHKGTLEVKSIENQGTTVTIRLPLSAR